MKFRIEDEDGREFFAVAVDSTNLQNSEGVKVRTFFAVSTDRDSESYTSSTVCINSHDRYLDKLKYSDLAVEFRADGAIYKIKCKWPNAKVDLVVE